VENKVMNEGVLYSTGGQIESAGDREVGRKDDVGKIRMELVPPSLITAVGTILTFGAKKYAPRNWEKGIAWGRVFGALMRHLWLWWAGENFDPETHQSHLWHAACCITFLIEYETTHEELDDRPSSAWGPHGG